MRQSLSLALFILASFAASAQPRQPDNFVAWREGLASSAQPSAKWLETVKERNYDVVINLAPPQSHGSFPDEGGIVGARGVTYLNIPVSFGKPTAEDFRVFSEVMKIYRGKSVFVHCQVNLRGSSFVFLYRVIHENAPVSETVAKLTGVWMPDRVWKPFIEETLKANGKAAEIF